MTTIVIVDARSREQKCFVASATKLPQNSSALVLRKAGGNIGTVEKLHGQTLEHPILVIECYQAQSSAGYTSQLYCSDMFHEVIWVGGAGFGFSSYDEETGKKIHRGYALRPFGFPLSGTLIPAGARVECVETHKNSNPDTANAACAALDLMVRCNPNLFILAEGQSDYTSATSFEVPEGAVKPEFDNEHRAEDIFSPENMLEAGIRRMVGSESGREGRIALRYAFLNAFLSADRSPSEANNFMDTVPGIVCYLIGDKVIKHIVETRYADLVKAGWKFDFNKNNMGGYYIRGVSPEGETLSNPLFGNKEVEEFLRHRDSEVK